MVRILKQKDQDENTQQQDEEGQEQSEKNTRKKKRAFHSKRRQQLKSMGNHLMSQGMEAKWQKRLTPKAKLLKYTEQTISVIPP